MAEIARKTKRYPSDLTEEEWQRILPLLPEPPRRGRKVGVDDEACRKHMQAWMLVRFRRERARAAEFGSTRYVWRSSGDDCARCSALNGRRFTFDLPPLGGHPGECLECSRGWCRCAMEPINAGFD